MSNVQDSINHLFDSTIDEFEQAAIESVLTEARKRMELADKNFAIACEDKSDSTAQLLLSTAMLHELRAANLLALVTLEASASRLS